MSSTGLIFVAVGLFTALAAVLDWDFFMEHRKASLFVHVLGRGGARIVYVLLGAGLVVLGLGYSG